MCLTVYESVLPPKSNKAYFIGYKVVRAGNKSWFNWFTFYSGWNIPNGEPVYTRRFFKRGYFHVYLHKKDADFFAETKKYSGQTAKILPVRCYYKDVAAYGENHDKTSGAALKRIYIERKHLEK